MIYYVEIDNNEVKCITALDPYIDYTECGIWEALSDCVKGHFIIEAMNETEALKVSGKRLRRILQTKADDKLFLESNPFKMP